MFYFILTHSYTSLVRHICRSFEMVGASSYSLAPNSNGVAQQFWLLQPVFSNNKFNEALLLAASPCISKETEH